MTTDLYFGDCLDKLRTIPDKSIDLVVTDPPYVYDQDGGGGAFGTAKQIFRKELKSADITNGFNSTILDELVRVSKSINAYIWCSKKQIIPLLDYFVKGKNCHWVLLTWHKSNPIPACNNKYLSDTEYCLFFRESGVPIFGEFGTKQTYYITPINQCDKAKFMHPTIKPLHIIKNLVVNSSLRGGVVLDPFMGSGTTGVACKLLDRNFIGCEINETYYNIAKERINPDTTNLLF